MTSTADRARTLQQLHDAPEILVLANVWDVISATVVASTEGVKALATASHSIAATFGYEDGENIPFELHLDMVRRIVDAVTLPVSMDFEAGYGDPGETARWAMSIGAVGANLEDEMKPLEEAVAAVEAVVKAGDAEGVPFVLNARTDAFVKAGEGDDPEATLAEAIRRGKAFLDAGAPCVFVPRAVQRDHVERLVEAFGRGRLSVILPPGAPLSVAELEQIGAARVSTGPYTQRVALTALQDAASAIVAGGALPDGTRALN